MPYKVPKSEISKVELKNKKGEKFLITQKANEVLFFLYKIENDKLTKLGQANSPIKLETKFNVWKTK